MNNLVVSKILDTEVRSLRNKKFCLIDGSGKQFYPVTDGAEMREVLDTRFGVTVSEEEGGRLFEGTPV